jgi:PKD repeat protein
MTILITTVLLLSSYSAYESVLLLPTTSTPLGSQTCLPSEKSLTNLRCSESAGTLVAAGVPAAFWTNVSTGTAPSPRDGASMAYDPVDGYLVLFGGEFTELNHGVSHSGYLNDTWEFAGGSWTNITLTAGVAPSPRAYSSLSFDSADGYLLLIGGNCVAGSCPDLWTFVHGTWTSVNPNWPAALASANLVAAFDSTDGFEVVQSLSGFSGATWKFHGGSWTDLTFNSTTNSTSPPGPGFYYPVMVDDPAALGVLFFGGYDNGLAPDHPVGVINATWLFSGGKWTNLTGTLATSPAPRYFAAASYDSSNQGVLLFGGLQPTPTASIFLGGTWLFEGGAWHNASGLIAPPLSQGPTLGWDGQDNASILFGGDSPLLNSTVIDYNSTWEWSAAPFMDGLSIRPDPNPVDFGSSTQFGASFSGGVSPFGYAWSFGDGSTGSGANPTHTYLALGTYTVNVTVADSAGHTLATSVDESVLAGANASPSATPSPTDVGLSTHFNPGSSGGTGSGTFTWSFGDGTQTNLENATHSYAIGGVYTVSFWSNDTGGAHVASSFVLLVNSALGSPSIMGSPTSPALGQLVNFTATEIGGTTPYAYSWAFGDGTIGGNLQNISHIFTTNGPFTAGVRVTDSAGAISSGFVNLTVVLNLTVLGQWSAGAAPLGIGFTSQARGGSPGYIFLWHFGDGGTSTLANPAHTFTQPGSYQVEATVSDVAGHQAQASWAVYVAPGGGMLAVSLRASPQVIRIGGSTVVTSAVSGGTGGYTYVWSGGAGTCGGQTILLEGCNGSFPGQYTVSLEVRDSTGTTASGEVTILVASGTSSSNPPGGLGPFAIFESGYLWVALVALAVGGVTVGLMFQNHRAARRLRVGNPGYQLDKSSVGVYATHRTVDTAGDGDPTTEVNGGDGSTVELI